MDKKILITGAAGFIGSHVIRLFVTKYPNYMCYNLDALTYAGNLENLKDICDLPNYQFIKGDITDTEFIENLFQEYEFDGVIHLAAESHVDRSITDPLAFIRTNVLGTANLLNAAKNLWKGNYEGKRFYHVSTDEVYGSLGKEGFFTEKTPYDPRSPYSASKASSDHFVRAFHDTYGMPTIVTNCSNNYGPYQFPEKLIPVMFVKASNDEKLPVYGEGANVRDWLYVDDHCKAIDMILENGRIGEVYNIGGHNEMRNIDIVKLICKELGKPESLITYVTDRKGHDMRYAIDPTKIHNELGWLPETKFDAGIKKTIQWYLDNRQWWENIISGEYQNYYSTILQNLIFQSPQHTVVDSTFEPYPAWWLCAHTPPYEPRA